MKYLLCMHYFTIGSYFQTKPFPFIFGVRQQVVINEREAPTYSYGILLFPQLYSSHIKTSVKLIGPFLKIGHTQPCPFLKSDPKSFYEFTKKVNSQHNAAKTVFM